MSSVEDNLPNTAIEAMACGIPIVGFDLGGIPDIIDHKKTGFLAEAKNSDDLSEGIEWVLSESDRGVDFSKHCQVKVKKDFAFELQAEAYKQLYSKISKNQINNRAETETLNEKGKDHIHHGDFGKISNTHQNPLNINTTNSNPNDIETLTALAKICTDLEKTEDAKDFYDRILALDPSNLNAVEELNNLKHPNDPLPSSICECGGNCQTCSCEEGYLVSAIVSCYNSEDFILGRLEDLENQTISRCQQRLPAE